jgi:Macrocin-O-methyltransferase (TylF)
MMTDYLPTIGKVPNAIRKGRNVYEGYQRGWGLEYGDLRQHVARDQDYIDAFRYAEGRSVAALDRLMNLFLLVKFYLPKQRFGRIIEYGSYRGGSAFFMAALASKFLPGVRVYALDTYAGMPKTDTSVDAHNAGDFATTSLDEVQAAKHQFGLTNIEFVKGLFSDTAPGTLAEAKAIALAHIDCDIYEAVGYTYDVSRPSMVPMGYIVFDDSTASSCIGATEAVEELVVRRDGLLSEQIFPHHVFRAPMA